MSEILIIFDMHTSSSEMLVCVCFCLFSLEQKLRLIRVNYISNNFIVQATHSTLKNGYEVADYLLRHKSSCNKMHTIYNTQSFYRSRQAKAHKDRSRVIHGNQWQRNHTIDLPFSLIPWTLAGCCGGKTEWTMQTLNRQYISITQSLQSLACPFLLRHEGMQIF